MPPQKKLKINIPVNPDLKPIDDVVKNDDLYRLLMSYCSPAVFIQLRPVSRRSHTLIDSTSINILTTVFGPLIFKLLELNKHQRHHFIELLHKNPFILAMKNNNKTKYDTILTHLLDQEIPTLPLTPKDIIEIILSLEPYRARVLIENVFKEIDEINYFMRAIDKDAWQKVLMLLMTDGWNYPDNQEAFYNALYYRHEIFQSVEEITPLLDMSLRPRLEASIKTTVLVLDGNWSKLKTAEFVTDGINVFKNLQPLYNFFNTDLAGAYLAGASFESNIVTFTSTNLSNANFTDTYLSSALFGDEVNATAADFTRAYLTNAIFSDCIFTSANFTGANLRRVRFYTTNLSNITVDGADFTDAEFSADTNLAGVRFANANLKGAYLLFTPLSKTQKRDAKKNGAIISLTAYALAITNDASPSFKQIDNFQTACLRLVRDKILSLSKSAKKTSPLDKIKMNALIELSQLLRNHFTCTRSNLNIIIHHLHDYKNINSVNGQKYKCIFTSPKNKHRLFFYRDDSVAELINDLLNALEIFNRWQEQEVQTEFQQPHP